MPSLTTIKSLFLLFICYLQDSGIWIASTQVSLDLTEFCVFPQIPGGNLVCTPCGVN